MTCEPRRIAHLVLLSSALGLTQAAVAELRDKPPEGVNLPNTVWRIDPRRSQNPDTVIARAKEDDDTQGRRNRDRIGGGVFDGDDDRWGRSADPGGPWRDEMPGGASHPGGARHRGELPGGGSVETDPVGSSQSMSIRLGGSKGSNPYLGQLRKNPDELTFLQFGDKLKILADGVETTCRPGGQAEPITDSYGDGEIRCGWDKRAWVVETTRGDLFTRKDSYELSKDGKTLKYNTTATGKAMPRIRISRTYTTDASAAD